MQKDTENINSRVSNTSNGKTMLLPKCPKCGSKKIKIQESGFRFKNENLKVKGISSNLDNTPPLSKAPLLGDILF